MKPGSRRDRDQSPLVRRAVDERIDEFDLRAIAALILVDQNLCFFSRISAQNTMLRAPSIKNRLEQIEVFWGYCDIGHMHHIPPKD
jgi:hypothetical protein